MRAGGSSLLGAAAAAAALLAGCTTREIHATPFAVTVTDPAGKAVVAAAGTDVIVVQGAVTSVEAARLVVDDPNLGGAIAIAFEPRASPGVEFPPGLLAGTVAVEVAASTTARAPDGSLIAHPAVRVLRQDTPVGPSFQFVLGEGDLEQPSGLPDVPPLLRPTQFEDTPAFEILADNTQLEPAACGLLYYDVLHVMGGTASAAESLALRRGEQGDVHVDPLQGAARPAWHVRHVLTFHRTDCSRAPRAWTQFAAWRG